MGSCLNTFPNIQILPLYVFFFKMLGAYVKNTASLFPVDAKGCPLFTCMASQNNGTLEWKFLEKQFSIAQYFGILKVYVALKQLPDPVRKHCRTKFIDQSAFRS